MLEELKTFMHSDYSKIPAVLVKNHGPFTWGKDAVNAVHHSVVLEEVAMLAYYTEYATNNTDAILSRTLLDKHYLRKHGEKAYYGQRNNLKGE